MRNVVLRTGSLLALLLLVAACDSDPEGPDVELPAADGAELLTYLEEQDYQANWTLWPGKGELYEGGTPHGMLLTTYLNDSALEALQDQGGAMPPGAIIVKENYTAGDEPALVAITPMYKVQGYNPDFSDWFWAKYDLPGPTIDAEGRVEGCQSCHQAAAANDFVFTAPLQ